MKHVKCSGSPYEIGLEHGRAAREEVCRSISFYEEIFKRTTGLTWPQVQEVAQRFNQYLDVKWPDYVAEMKGVAQGAEVDYESVLALNVRTEIRFGMALDGCTAFSWKTMDGSYLAQNWDWNHESLHHLICIHITQPGKPTIHMMTEGGIIGKIGLNSAGVGVTLNAIESKGVRFDKLPVHLALRAVLDSNSRAAATSTLKAAGIAAPCHITIADAETGGIGLECTSVDIVELLMDSRGICTHTNHCVKKHEIPDRMFVLDSPFRLERVEELLNGIEKPSLQRFEEVLRDEKNFPGSICRGTGPSSTIETIFSIVMDLEAKRARVKLGRPTEDGEALELRP